MFRKVFNGPAEVSNNATQLSVNESENLFHEVYAYDIHKINVKKLEKLIHQGQGFYAAYAIHLMYRVIDREVLQLMLIDSSNYKNKIVEKNKYIKMAEKNDPLVAAYLSVDYAFDAAKLLVDSPRQGFKEIESSIEKFKSCIQQYPESNKLLTMNFCKELNKQIRNMERWDPLNPDIQILMPQLQLQIEIGKTIKSPLDYFERTFSRLKQNYESQKKMESVDLVVHAEKRNHLGI